MTTPGELALTCTDLSAPQLAHLQRLLGSWSVLADLSFSDLLLVVPTSEIPGEEPELVVLGQIRPNNRPTLLVQDLVGQTVTRSAWSLATAALEREEIVRGAVHHPLIGEAVPVENVPVRFAGGSGSTGAPGHRPRPDGPASTVIAVMVRVYPRSVHTPVRYERNYLDVYGRLATMITESAFPFPDEDVGTEETPRVGDGFVLVDADARVEFASPNALNAFHRMGIYSTAEGKCFTELGIDEPVGESAVQRALAGKRPVVEEVERRPDVIVLVQCIPLLEQGKATGAVVLLRDVTDVRRLDRLLLSKDAAIREVHHRVKNNLQTISSLLSLQARRLTSADGKAALYEAERRVRSIALVHEILARDPGDEVPFGEIVQSLVRMAEDSVVSARPVEISVTGDLGEVTADVATPLAVTLAELLQNAVEHAFDEDEGGRDLEGEAKGAEVGGAPRSDRAGAHADAGAAAGAAPGHVWVTLAADRRSLAVTVRDDGRGIDDGFDIDRTTSLGLSIVRDLVVSQLGGTIEIGRADPRGTEVSIRVPLPARR